MLVSALSTHRSARLAAICSCFCVCVCLHVLANQRFQLASWTDEHRLRRLPEIRNA